MSKATTLKGTPRQRIQTASGLLLERRYVYLPPEVWEALYALSSVFDISASQYICDLINAAKVGTIEKDKNNETIPSSRPS